MNTGADLKNECEFHKTTDVYKVKDQDAQSHTDVKQNKTKNNRVDPESPGQSFSSYEFRAPSP